MALAERPTTRIPAILVLGIAAIGFTWQQTRPAPITPPAVTTSVSPATELVKENVSIRPGDTLEALLDRSGVDAELRMDLIAAVRKEFDVRRFRAGAQLTLLRSDQGTVLSVEYVLDPDHKLELAESSGEFVARIVDIPGTVRPQVVCGTLEGSLFESMARTGEQPELTMQIAEIFAWDIDFYRDPQPGDQFCLLVEKKEYDDGAPATYRRVLAAKYDNAGTVYDAYLFNNPDGEERYYSSDGQSLQAAFLRSPLKFDARISSHFSRRRLHPVRGVYRAHLGTDYAAPLGTPVQAVADGRAIFSDLSGSSGNLVTLQHANGYVTQYLHLSKRLVRKGDRVKQGQRIGLVGMTGLATGPHVDIRIRKNGQYLNWATLKLPRQSRIAAANLQEFKVVRDRFTGMMASGPDSGAKLASADSAPTVAP